MKKIKKFAKNLFSANRMKMLAMMLLCGTAVTFAQNAAGDYTAGTNALSTVTEEIAKYVPYVVKLCYAQEEDYDGCRCLHLPRCSCTGSASLLRSLNQIQA